MGTIKKGILGGFSGVVGTVTGGNWKGIDYMRSRATSISNPRTRHRWNNGPELQPLASSCTSYSFSAHWL